MPKQQFGGPWTDEKLSRIEAYLHAYTTALKNQPFDLLYIDAFAGPGYRSTRATAHSEQFELGLAELEGYGDLAKGSPRRALEVHPHFDRYIFIEKDRDKLAELRKLESEYPDHADRMQFIGEDANTVLDRLCKTTDWRRTRAVLFLDPFGMQVDWTTVETVAKTKSVDLWYLFPAGAVTRLITREGAPPEKWQLRLDRSLGDRRWRDVFYPMSRIDDLFDDEKQTRERAIDIKRIEAYFRSRLQTIFVGVGKRALPLTNKAGFCMYLLFFACSNQRGRKVALRIAEHILKN